MPYSIEQLAEDKFILGDAQSAGSSASVTVTKYVYCPLACTIVGASFAPGNTSATATVKRGSTTVLTIPALASGTNTSYITTNEASTTLTVDAGENLNINIAATSSSCSFVSIWAKRRMV